jgi:osmotically-inducible protein OsmY
MPDRFRDRDYGRRPRRDDYGERGEFERTDYSDRTNRTYGSSFGDRSTFNRDEGYFGGNRSEGFGEGYGHYEPNRAFGYSWRDSTGYSNYDYPERRYESTTRRSGFGRDAYGLGYGGDWEPEANRRTYNREPYQGRDYERGYYRQSGYKPEYPRSERGFETERRGERSWWDRASDEVSSWFGDEEAERRRQMDARGGYRGRGPKNYTRSDERIKEDVNERLTDYDYIDASDIEVEVNNSEVVLSGSVESRYEKRAAEDIAESVTGVRNVENRLRIRRDQQQYAGGDWAYTDTAGHTELNRSETAATHTATGQAEIAKARGKSSSV